MSLFVFMACNNPHGPNAMNAADTAKYYPLRGFFKEQIEYVDLRDFPLYEIRTVNGKKDSLPISKEQFIAIAGRFLDNDISDPRVKIQYHETVFQDQSTGSITLNYSPVNKETRVKNIDILLDQETKQVKRVFIRSAYQKKDTLVTEQYSWKANKSFLISKSLQTADGFQSTETTFVNWNDKP